MKAENNPHGLKLGQKLWFIHSDSRRGQNHEVTVTKIGRKWITVDEDWSAMRLDPTTLSADGGNYSSPGYCCLSRDDYEREQRTAAAWRELYQRLTYSPPDGMTVNRVIELAEEFGIPVEIVTAGNRTE